MYELPDLVITPEVKNVMRREKSISVILSPKEEVPTEEVERFLKKLRIPFESSEYFFCATLSPAQITAIEQQDKDRKYIDKIWLNREVKGMLRYSSQTIKASVVHRTFESRGEGITWAVIDSGVDFSHPALKEAKFDQEDFTGEGKGDQDGHGTHVAGIIAARAGKDDAGNTIEGIAPAAKIHDLKVLDKNGRGSTFSVIKALERVRHLNRERKEMVIHGANISLGSSSDPFRYGVGQSPVCLEANRLVNSGVVVCVAASNDGYKILPTVKPNGAIEAFGYNIDISISDPGNASDVITVGSVHKRHPFKHGISFFSSKGPTGDGRLKPDLVAPGEKIISCAKRRGYTTMSGTSQATPHVSGALALFLSVKPEFIGYPRDVKKILLEACTDLERDRYFQGHGLIDVFRMVQAV